MKTNTRNYIIEITYQPINKTWGAMIKKGNILGNQVNEDLKVALSEIADTILLTEGILDKMDKNQSVKSDHICTSVCNNSKDCPVCPHGYDEENFCEECDETSEKPVEKMDNADLDKDLMDKLNRKDLEKEMREVEENNPYRHIEEANEENYKAVEARNNQNK